MINIIFKNNKPVGYATVSYSSSDKEEVVKEKSEQELTDLLSDILEQGETWRNKYRYLSLNENEEVYLDRDRFVEDLKEQYESDEVTKKELDDKVENGIITESECEYITGEEYQSSEQ